MNRIESEIGIGRDIFGGNRIDSRSRFYHHRMKRARPTIRCHVDRAFLLDISPTFFSPVNLFPLPLPLLLSTPRYENSIISKFRFRTKTRINSISPLFIRRLIEISMQMVRTDEEISRRTGFLPTLLRNVIGKDYNRMNFPSPRGNLFFI